MNMGSRVVKTWGMGRVWEERDAKVRAGEISAVLSTIKSIFKKNE